MNILLVELIAWVYCLRINLNGWAAVITSNLSVFVDYCFMLVLLFVAIID